MRLKRRTQLCAFVLGCAAVALCVGVLFDAERATAAITEEERAIRRAALDYIEAQHKVDGARMERSVHPLLVKRAVYANRKSGKQFLLDTTSERMIQLAETYNRAGDKFPKKPKKEVIIFDRVDSAASVKLIADEWIDYMHLAKLNGQWKVVNVLWQYHDVKRHR
ncbi:MAG: nuclear transport factor 2 family protein [Proteobacteria bacterium]|nr:nuclear transport factor 2 family protein [Pseudomonadota bacterium]